MNCIIRKKGGKFIPNSINLINIRGIIFTFTILYNFLKYNKSERYRNHKEDQDNGVKYIYQSPPPQSDFAE